MRISDWSSDVCSSDLRVVDPRDGAAVDKRIGTDRAEAQAIDRLKDDLSVTARLAHSNPQPFSRGFRHRSAAARLTAFRAAQLHDKIGRASCRERVWQYV